MKRFSRPAPLGYCPLCAYLCRLRKDGKVGRHWLGTALWRNPRGYGVRCDGEGREPVTKEEADRAYDEGRLITRLGVVVKE